MKRKNQENAAYWKMTAWLTCALTVGSAIMPGMAWAEKSQADNVSITSVHNKKNVQAITEKSDTDIAEYELPELTVETKRPDWEVKLSPGTVTVIRPDDYKGEQKTLSELLKQVPGVHVHEANGKGQYTTVSVRGSTAAQVGIFVDGVLSNMGGDAAVDISTIPIDNVERIEVYRGYIPARFGGTFMGGVINIVTKRPTKANVSASVGQSSYGGYKGNLQVDAPMGDGSLMFGLNHEQSEGNFKYTNSYNTAELSAQEKKLNTLLSPTGMLRSINLNINKLTTLGSSYLTYDQAMAILKDPALLETLHTTMKNNTNGKYNEGRFTTFIADLFTMTSTQQKTVDELRSSDRWRKSNDYKNTDIILKWQDNHWLAKATWKQIDRHYPEPISNNYGEPAYLDLVDDPIYNHRFQKITTAEGLLGRRDTVGNLEWGWQVDYLKQTKEYHIDNWQVLAAADKDLTKYPSFWWSNYDSKRLGYQFDGTYKAGKRNLLEFLLSGSKETMDVNGWHMFDELLSQDTRKRFRNHYEQTIFNAQLQDTITLNKKGNLWLTPSIRYNQSKIMGRSDHFDKYNDPANVGSVMWFNQTDEQTDGKATWQLALKKKVNDNLTLRATGGTYYRLLNMYEIAGDGAGILPMPNIGRKGQCVFPEPEEGSQWDLSAIWDKPILGAQSSKIQLTYFGRDSSKMLQLGSWNNFFFAYTNGVSAKVNGVELQANLSWEKWDVDLEGTYTQPYDVTYDLSKFPGASYWQNNGINSGHLTYIPKWEGTMRLTYRPDFSWGIFGQMHYTGSMNTTVYNDGAGVDQSSLETWDIGMKWKPDKNTQVIIGINDLFNAADKMYVQNTFYQNQAANTIQYPIQGRTYYMTVQHNF